MPYLGEVQTAKELQRKGSYKYQWFACIDCGKERWVPLVYGLPNSKRCSSCHPQNNRGEQCSSWKGGRHQIKAGYIRVLVQPSHPHYSMKQSGGYILEHRLIMAETLGRDLRKSEIVHHLNGVRTDNRKENLVLVNTNNHPTKTYIKLLQKRILQLEQLRLAL